MVRLVEMSGRDVRVGQLGLGTDVAGVNSPMPVSSLAGVVVSDVCAGGRHSLAYADDVGLLVSAVAGVQGLTITSRLGGSTATGSSVSAVMRKRWQLPR